MSMDNEQKSLPTFTLVTVNTAPERAYRLVGRTVKALKARFIVKHVGNCETISQVGPKIRELQPDILFAASMWSKEEAERIFAAGHAEKSNIKTYAIPQGLQVEKGPDVVVEHLINVIPGILADA